jgi:formylglycine-generating enzyme required for sulfatase activity
MFCATCNLEYPEHLNFCRRCGQTLVRALGERATESVCCTRCGARVIHGEKFCQHCGTRVGAVAQETVVGLCRNCETYWRNSWQFCKSCGVDRQQALHLNPPTVGQRAPVEIEPAEPRSPCPYCHVATQPFSLFCENCGMRLAAASESAEPITEKEAQPQLMESKAKPGAPLEEDDTLSRLDDPLLDDPLEVPVPQVPLAPALTTVPATNKVAAEPAYPPLRLVEKPRETIAFPTNVPVMATAEISAAPVSQSWRAAVSTAAPVVESSTGKLSQRVAQEAALFLGEASPARRPFWHVPLLLGSVLLGSFLLVGVWRKAQSVKETSANASGQPAAATNGTAVKLQNAAPPAPPGMSYIPGGKFEMGRLDGTPDERPLRVLELKPFFLDRTEVTNQQYLAYVEATGRRAPSHWRAGKPLSTELNFPVVNITWQDANDFAAWAGKRLPTEEEWEFAARGTDGRLYPWGKDWDAASANTVEGKAGRMVEVGRYLGGASPYGIVDMCGNVWEWTSSQLRSYGTQELLEDGLMVIRGGAFDSPKEFATTTYRGAVQVGKTYPKTGFRCARDLP